jgi:hypothetical protein
MIARSSVDNRIRFHTSHLLLFVIAAAFVLAIIRHPEAFWAALVPLIGGLLVVLPVLGAAEFMSNRDSTTPDIGWLSGCLIALVALVGVVLATLCLFALSNLAP